jgi:hypothetical protein
MVTEVTATTLMWHISIALLNTNEYYWRVAHSHIVVEYKRILQIVNKKLYSGRIKATCCG